MGAALDLPELPEPMDLRALAASILRENPAVTRASPHSGADPLAFIYGNRLPRYLWTGGWGPRLVHAGTTLEDFLRTVGSRRRQFIRWAMGELPWGEYLRELERGVAPRGGRSQHS